MLRFFKGNNWLLFFIIWVVLDVKYDVVLMDFCCSLFNFFKIFMVSCVLGNVGRFGLKFLKVKDCGLGEF